MRNISPQSIFVLVEVKTDTGKYFVTKTFININMPINQQN